MAECVYILCASTSLGCALLLLRAYLRQRLRLLLWSCLCFVGLTLNNVLLYIDYIIVPEIDMSIARGMAGLLGMGALVYGLIWDTI